MERHYKIPDHEEIIFDGGANNICIAKVKHKGEIKYAIRKNGSPKYPFGQPIRFSKSIWLILPDALGEYIEKGFAEGSLNL